MSLSFISSWLSVHGTILLTEYRLPFFVCTCVHIYLLMVVSEWIKECKHENIYESGELESNHVYNDSINHECMVGKQDRL